MRVKRLNIRDFRGIEKLELDFDPRLNVFIGDNGTGKSTILDFLALMLSKCRYFDSEFELSGKNENIRAGQMQYEGEIILQHQFDGKKGFFISEYIYAERGEGYSFYENTDGVLEHVENMEPFKQFFEEISHDDSIMQARLPLVAYYPTNRAILEIPERIRTYRPATSPFNAYDNALSSALDFRTFIGRFRECEADQDFLPIDYPDPFLKWHRRQHEAVQEAIQRMIPEFKDLHVEKKPFKICIEKNAQKIGFGQLSDGEKCLLALVGDIALRLAIANPGLTSPLEGEGVILIDEIELHLHPKWQRRVIPNLLSIFPHCQFMLSTHSPQVLGEIDQPCRIRKLIHDETITVDELPQMNGYDANYILEEFMNTSCRNQDFEKLLHDTELAIEDRQYDLAQRLLSKISETTGAQHADALRLSMRLNYAKRKDEKNHENEHA